MRLATLAGDQQRAVIVDRDRVLPLDLGGALGTMRDICQAGTEGLAQIAEWARSQPASAYRSLSSVELGAAIPDPGAIYTVGQNYRAPDEPPGKRAERPLVYGKVPTSVVGSGSTITWDRSLTANVDGECELGVLLGPNASIVGYTIVNDVTSQDAWLDGDQWLLGKSMPGFCPVGPWVVTADELDPADLRLRFSVNGTTVQDGRTSGMRFSIGEIVAYLSAHLRLRPGDLIATGTPSRIRPDAGRHLQPNDRMTASIDGIGELTNTIA